MGRSRIDRICRHAQIAFVGMLCTLIGCSGGSSSGGGAGGGGGTTITVTFTGIGNPTAVAVKIGTGFFAPATLQGNQLTFTLPNGTTNYAIAWVCPISDSVTFEEIREATVEDGTALTMLCVRNPTPTPTPSGSATGIVDASAIAGASEFLVYGKAGFAGNVNAASGPFDFNMPAGTNDVAIIAAPFASGTMLAVKIIRNQTVPGTINGGNTITFGPADLLTMQPLTFTNLPSGFGAGTPGVSYFTENGGFDLSIHPPFSGQYPAVPIVAAQGGDGYLFKFGAANSTSQFEFSQTISGGGGAVTIALPDPWTYSGPTPSASPTFTFNYPPISAFPNVKRSAIIDWGEGQPNTTFFDIHISATPSFLNGSQTITIPDLSGIPGFLIPPSGTTIEWIAFISGDSGPGANSSQVGVSNLGTYTEP